MIKVQLLDRFFCNLNRKAYIVICFFIPLFATPLSALGQDSCDALMKYGIYDETETITERAQFRLFKSWMCESKFHSYAEAEKAIKDLDTNYLDIMSFKFNGADAKTQWDLWITNFCKTEYEEIRNNFSFKSKIRTISPALMKVVKACIEHPQRAKLYAYIRTSSNRKIFSFSMFYYPAGGEHNTIDAIAFTPPALEKRCGPLSSMKPGVEVTASIKTLTCEVDPKETVAVTVNTQFGSASVILDGVEDRPIPPEIKWYESHRTEITRGETAVLRWITSDANLLTIEPNIGNVTGLSYIEIAPTTTTTYTLVATGPGGVTQKSVTVNVNTPAPTAIFRAATNPIFYGQELVIGWETTNAVAVNIDQGIGPVELKGTRIIAPRTTVTYQLVATGLTEPKAIQNLTITVNPKVRVFENTGLGGRSLDVVGALNFPDPFFKSISSVQVFTDEWVKFQGEIKICHGRECETEDHYLYIKGPGTGARTVDLHTIGGLPNGRNWGDIIKAVWFEAPPPGGGGATIIQ